MSHTTTRRAGAGVTIVELLVAIGVVALLLGLLVPALAQVKAAARSVKCQSNLRSMAIAAQHYASLHDQWPAALLFEQKDGALHQVAWDWVTTFFGGELISAGPLWGFTDDPGEVMQCPDYHGTTNFSDPFTGYNYNTSYLGDEERFTLTGSGDIRRGIRPHACRRSTACAMFGDGGWAPGTNKFMRAPLNAVPGEGGLQTIYAGGQSFRHRGTTNVAYVDGHVGSVDTPQPGLMGTPPLLEQFLGFPDNGFLSDDDSAYDPR